VSREPALVDGRAGCHAQHQQTVFAKRKWQDAMFRVNTESPPSSMGRAGCHAQHQQTVFAKRKWQDAMRIAGTLCFLGTVRSLPLISQARLPWRGRRGSFEQ
jgi:hypothetical protein